MIFSIRARTWPVPSNPENLRLEQRKRILTSKIGVTKHSPTKFSTSAKVVLNKSAISASGNLRSKNTVENKKPEVSIIVRDRNGENATPLSLGFTKSGRVDSAAYNDTGKVIRFSLRKM